MATPSGRPHTSLVWEKAGLEDQVALASQRGSRGLRLSYTQMEGTAFRSCQLEQASFKGAWLDNAIFVGARLYGTSFATANARGTNFSDADLRYTSFSGADLTAAKFITSSSGTTGVLGDVLMPDASAFREADLTEIDLAGSFVASEEWLDVLEDESLKFEESPHSSAATGSSLPPIASPGDSKTRTISVPRCSATTVGESRTPMDHSNRQGHTAG